MFVFLRSSFSLIFEHEVLSPLASIDETIQTDALLNLLFEYSVVATNQERTHEFNYLNEKSTALVIE